MQSFTGRVSSAALAGNTDGKESIKKKKVMGGNLHWGEKNGVGVFSVFMVMLHLSVAYLESSI